MEARMPSAMSPEAFAGPDIDPRLIVSAPPALKGMAATEDKLAPVRLQMGGFQRSLKGEDRYLVRRAAVGVDTVDFGVVADGHGGDLAAEYIIQHVVDYIVRPATACYGLRPPAAAWLAGTISLAALR